MKQLWAPWRMQYLGEPPPGCFFCAADASADDDAHLVVARDRHALILLNKYPYGHAHLLVAPRRHVGRPDDLDDETYAGVMEGVRHASRAIRSALRPEGMNIGMNVGSAAGAGVPDHCHWHLLPRWLGDTNFMPLIGETKVLSEHLQVTLERLRPFFD